MSSFRGLRAWVAAVVLAATCATTAQAAPGPVGWVARHNLSSAQYQKAFTDFSKQGFRLKAVSGYVLGSDVRYAAVWQKVAGPPYVAKHGMTSASYQQNFDTLSKQGYRLVFIDGYTVSGSDRFAAIWEKRSGPAWAAKHGMTAAQYQAAFDDFAKKGYRLIHISGYGSGGQDRFAAIWEKGSGPAYVAKHGMTTTSYQANFDDMLKKGYRLKEVSGYNSGNSDRYAAIWEKSAGPVWRARHGVPNANYQRMFDVDRFEGFVPQYVQVFKSGSTARFQTIWTSPFSAKDFDTIHKTFQDFVDKKDSSGKPKVAGIQVAIAKDSKLLYAAGYGWADVENKVPMDIHHTLRIASVSKPITTAAVYKLSEERGEKLVDRKVFGPGGLLPNVTVPDAMADLKGATLAQFLDHTAGLPGNEAVCKTGVGPCGLKNFANCSATGFEASISAEFKRHDDESKAMGVSPLRGKPGAVSDYSNQSQQIAGAVVQRLSGTTYLKYVQQHVLAPAGITDATWFHLGPYDASSGEAKHYKDDGTYASYSADSACDADKATPHGGAGGWAMTALDLLRFLRTVDGKQPNELLTLGDYNDMLTPSAPNAGYARGWIVGNWGWCGTPAPIVLGHNGQLTGAWSEMHELTDGYSIAVIGNQDPGAGTCTSASGTTMNCYTSGSDAGPRCGDDAAVRLYTLRNKVDWPLQDLF